MEYFSLLIRFVYGAESMTQRIAEQICRLLEPRYHYFRGEDSENEEDFTEENDSENNDSFVFHKYNQYKSSEVDYGILVDSETNNSVKKQATSECKHKHKWYLILPGTQERQSDASHLLTTCIPSPPYHQARKIKQFMRKCH